VSLNFNVWLHVDAAYAGSSFICPEYRDRWFKSRQRIDSFVFNPSKWFLCCFDITAFWVADSTTLHNAFSVNPLYLQHKMSNKAIDFMHWQIPLSKKFRALKLWFVIRYFGVEKMQEYIRRHEQLAKYFARLVLSDDRFEIPVGPFLGLCIFRLKGPNELTETLLAQITSEGLVYMVPATFLKDFIIRFTVTSQDTTEADIDRDWGIIRKWAEIILDKVRKTVPPGFFTKPITSKTEQEEIFTNLEEDDLKINELQSNATEDRVFTHRLSDGYQYVVRSSRTDVQLRNVRLSKVSLWPLNEEIVNGSFATAMDNKKALARLLCYITWVLRIYRRWSLKPTESTLASSLQLDETRAHNLIEFLKKLTAN
ncbi:hypothetical protein Ciccas_008587, partial [Cichlidogyrus casuarinus]